MEEVAKIFIKYEYAIRLRENKDKQSGKKEKQVEKEQK